MIRKVRFSEDELTRMFGSNACVPLIDGLPVVEAAANIATPKIIGERPVLFQPADPTQVFTESQFQKEKINVQFSYKGVNYFFSARSFEVKLKEVREGFSMIRWELQGRIDPREFAESTFKL